MSLGTEGSNSWLDFSGWCLCKYGTEMWLTWDPFVLVCRRWTRDRWGWCSTASLMTRGVSASWPAWRHGSTLKCEIFHSQPTHVSFLFWTGFVFIFLYGRWHPSECRVCCCLSSPNWSTSPSSETSGQRTRAQGFSVTGWASDILQTFTFNTRTRGKTTTRTLEDVRRRVSLVFLRSSFPLSLRATKVASLSACPSMATHFVSLTVT